MASATIHAFTGATRPHPTSRWRRPGTPDGVADLTQHIRRRDEERERNRPVAQRSPITTAMCALYLSLPEEVRKETRRICYSLVKEGEEGWEEAAEAWGLLHKLERA